jgi:hypothetical protein
MFTLARKEGASRRLIKHAAAPFLRSRPLEVHSTCGVDWIGLDWIKALMSVFHQPVRLLVMLESKKRDGSRARRGQGWAHHHQPQLI